MSRGQFVRAVAVLLEVFKFNANYTSVDKLVAKNAYRVLKTSNNGEGRMNYDRYVLFTDQYFAARLHVH